jgi:hypothetical protein
MTSETYFIPIFPLVIDGDKCIVAYLNKMTAHTDYPTLGLFYNYINESLESFFEQTGYKPSDLKILYQHTSNSEYYVWDTQTKVSFETRIPKASITEMLENGYIYSIKNIELDYNMPHILFLETE